MKKKFLSAILLVFAFLFLNIGLNSFNVKAEESQSSDPLHNAGYGKLYWAIANYGADYTSDLNVTIDIQKEAIANQNVKYIVITEPNYTSSSGKPIVYYERNKDVGFSSRVEYIMKNEAYGKKQITIFLLTEFMIEPTEDVIVDKITISVDRKHPLTDLDITKIKIIPDVTEETTEPYNIHVTLDESCINEYVIKNVKYRLAKNDLMFLNATKSDFNDFYFRVYQNGVYDIELEDVFGNTITVSYTVNNIIDPEIYLVAYPEKEGYTNKDYKIGINVLTKKIQYDSEGNEVEVIEKLSNSDIAILTVTFIGNVLDIRNSDLTYNGIFTISNNGTYIINAETNNGSKADLIIEINNIDREAPSGEVLKEMVVYTDNLDSFHPRHEIYVYDNVTEGEKIKVELSYYLSNKVNENFVMGDHYTDDENTAKKYLYTVRDLFIKYIVTDEAGNYTIIDAHVTPIDNTKPVITHKESRMLLYINDPYPSEEYLIESYGIVITDNSCLDGDNCNEKSSFKMDFSELPVDENNRMNKLGEYRIFLSAVDEAGNLSDEVVLTAEVRQRLITVEVVPGQYEIYGDQEPGNRLVEYKCVNRETQNRVDCSEELLAGDRILGEIVVLNVQYVGMYDIYYDIRIPSDLYYLDIINEDTIKYEVKHRIIKIVAEDYEKFYLDNDPEIFNYKIIDIFTEEEIKNGYRKDLVSGDSITGLLERYMDLPNISGVIVFDPDNDTNKWSVKEAVWFYEADGTLAKRPITQGTLKISERNTLSISNYKIDFTEGEFLIKPKTINVEIEKASKIYGEEDPDYTISKCVGSSPIDGETLEFCYKELMLSISRAEAGETVGNYLINGTYGNKNYIVLFNDDSYLTIEKRSIQISVKGDSSTPGKYTIYYEDDIPLIEVYDSSTGEKVGLVKNKTINGIEINDSICNNDERDLCKAEIENLIDDYVNGIGNYAIRKGTITILDKDGNNAEFNYDITFNEGILEVIKKEIRIRILESLKKVYGNSDLIFEREYLDAVYPDKNYIILEAMGRFVIEIVPASMDKEEYIPRDNEKMKYYIKREDGKDVGFYSLYIDNLEGCENYDVSLLSDYNYEITKRDIQIKINDANIVYKGTLSSVLTYDEELANSFLPENKEEYKDRVDGEPIVEEFKNVGRYPIELGTIKIIDPDRDNLDISYNYNLIVTGGTLTVYQREIVVKMRPGQSKQYGDLDFASDIEFKEYLFDVYYNGEKEDIDREEYENLVTREEGEIPGRYAYNLNEETLLIKLNGELDGIRVGNYKILWDDSETDYFIITKRDISITTRGSKKEFFYGDIFGNGKNKDGELQLSHESIGLASNALLTINGSIIADKISSELEIVGVADVDKEKLLSVGEYAVKHNEIKILRQSDDSDVTSYYNITYNEGTFKVVPRIIYIVPDDNLSKIYGDDDVEITYKCRNNSSEIIDCESVIEKGDIITGKLERENRSLEGTGTLEDVGTYRISIGTLKINNNYELVLEGNKTYLINHRDLYLKANDIEIYYGRPYSLTYEIVRGSLADNDKLGIHDTITGSLTLNREYSGVGTYIIVDTELIISNKKNYNYNFSTGTFIVKTCPLLVVPDSSNLFKIYGEKDPNEFTFTSYFIDPNTGETTVLFVPSTGKLVRESGENAGKYKILKGTLLFEDEKNYDISIEETYFTILSRVIEVKPVKGQYKIYEQKDPVLKYTYVGILIGSDRFTGELKRDPGEDAGEYTINLGTLAVASGYQGNYTINYTPDIFTIRYAELTDIIITIFKGSVYQVYGKTEEVRLMADFNSGADRTHVEDIEWKVIKELSDGSTSEYEFIKTKEKDENIRNSIAFTPNGSAGRYYITATYGGITGTFEVVVEKAIYGNIFIEFVSGTINQVLGKETQVTYRLLYSEGVDVNRNVLWTINGKEVKRNVIKDSVYFTYIPTYGVGTYTVQAQVADRVSNALEFYVKNNNPPVITLIGDPVIYIEAKSGEQYIEQYARVIDDIDGDISDKLRYSGTVNTDVIGTYYIRYDATDSHGNNAITVYRQVVVRDTTPPTVTLIGDKEVKLFYGQEYVERGAIAVDNYDIGELEIIIDNKIIYNKTGIYEVIYTAYDSSGNRGSAVRYVEIIDNVPPTITLIGDEIVYVEVYDTFRDDGALVEDNMDGKFIITATTFYYEVELGILREVSSINTSKLGTYYAYYEYTDASGNIGASPVRTVVVRDTTPPVITLIGTNPYITRSDYPNVSYVEPGAIVTDNYDTDLKVAITGEVGNELGVYYIYYDAIDSNNNRAATVTRQVVVIDLDKPILHFYDRCPQYMTIEALYEEYDARCDLPGYGVWAEDNYQADLEGLQKRIVVRGSVDSTTVGTYVITYDVEDMNHNAAVTLKRYVTVVDTTKPEIKLLCKIDGEIKLCEDDTSQIVEVFEEYEELGAIIYDKYDEYHGYTIELKINHNVNINKLGEYLVIYNAVDSNGNRALTVTRRVYVKDTKAPVITIIGDNPITIERGIEYVEYGATAIDNYDGPIRYVNIINAPSGMKLGTFEVIYRAIDSSGNIGEATRIVNVVDTIPPIVLGVEDGMYYKEPVSIYFIPTMGTDEVLTAWLNEKIITSPWYVDEEGEYDLIVRDDAGNETRIWFAIDTTPPIILGVKDGEYTNREVVEVSANEKIKYFEYRYQNGDWIRVEEQTVNFVNEGRYRIYAVDMADNVSEVVSFVIDRTPPIYDLVGVINKGVTNTDVSLTVELEATIIVNSTYNIPNTYTFTEEGYYQVAIRDLAGNTVNLQFVINKDYTVVVNKTIITIITQHNAINKFTINGTNYPRNSGYLVAMPNIDGTFTYINSKLFSETEYQKLMNGESLEYGVSGSDDTYMFVAFVANSDELNKFGQKTVEDDEENNNAIAYIGAFIFIIAIILFFFIIFLKRRKKQQDEVEEKETTIDEF